MYFPKMIGDKCYLSPINPDDAAQFTRWINDLEVIQNCTLATANINVPNEVESLGNLARDHHYSIIDKSKDQLIGSCGLMDMDYCNRTAEIGIFIGDKNYWNAGYGSEALSLLIDYAFQYLNLDNIMLRVYDFNKRGLGSYEKVGFKLIGKRRNALKRFMKTFDIIYMDIVPRDFYKKHPSRSELIEQ